MYLYTGITQYLDVGVCVALLEPLGAPLLVIVFGPVVAPHPIQDGAVTATGRRGV